MFSIEQVGQIRIFFFMTGGDRSNPPLYKTGGDRSELFSIGQVGADQNLFAVGQTGNIIIDVL